jgi:hypothetical protein
MNTFDFLLLVAGYVRDIAAIVLAGAAALAFLIEALGLVFRKRPRLDSDILEKALLGLAFGVFGCFAPVEKGLLLGRTESVVLLVLGTLLWIVVFIVRRFARGPRLRTRRIRRG